MNLYYRLGANLYVNVTNMCHCDCTFCIRGRTESVGDAESLWLSREPSLLELKDGFVNRKPEHRDGIREIVFCGFGEPLERAELACDLADFIKSMSTSPLRLNTNGLVQLIEPGFDIRRLSVFDTISISLNADTKEEYLSVTRPAFGIESFDAMLGFAKAAKDLANVQFTIVETLEPSRHENCMKLASELGIPLIVRNLM